MPPVYNCLDSRPLKRIQQSGRDEALRAKPRFASVISNPPLPMDIDPHPVSFYNTFMKLLPFEFTGVSPFFGGFFRPDHDPPHIF